MVNQHILYFGRFLVDPFNYSLNLNVKLLKNEYFVIWLLVSKEHMIFQ